MIQVVNENPYTGGVATGVRMVKDFAGLSTDEKPTTGVVEGAFFRETDTARGYFFRNGQWVMTSGSEELPPVTAEDDGKALIVEDGAWTKGEVSGLPDVTGLGDGTALVKVGNEWKTQSGYPYMADTVRMTRWNAKTVAYMTPNYPSTPYFPAYIEVYKDGVKLLPETSVQSGAACAIPGTNASITLTNMGNTYPSYGIKIKLELSDSDNNTYDVRITGVTVNGHFLSGHYTVGLDWSMIAPFAYVPYMDGAHTAVCSDADGAYRAEVLYCLDDNAINEYIGGEGKAMVTMKTDDDELYWGVSDGYGVYIPGQDVMLADVDSSVQKSGTLDNLHSYADGFNIGSTYDLYVNDTLVGTATLENDTSQSGYARIHYVGSDYDIVISGSNFYHVVKYTITGSGASSINSVFYGTKGVDTVKKFNKKLIPDALPDFTAADEGKVLKIVSGVPTWVTES